MRRLPTLRELVPAPPPPPDGRLRLLVLGDSNAHAYGDTLWFPPGSGLRGGAERAWQWTEVLARRRGDAIDLGAWGLRGRSARAARLARRLGRTLRVPAKEDFAWCFAWSGAGTADLLGEDGQATQAAREIARAPAAWADAVAVVRIGFNDLCTPEALDPVVRDGPTPAWRERVATWTGRILESVRVLRRAQPSLGVVLVGPLDATAWPPLAARYADPAARARVAEAQDAFDAPLRAWAEADPRGAFLEDRAWLRGPDAPPAPHFLDDHHCTTAVNAAFAARLVRLLRTRFAATVPPLPDDGAAP
ncbi:MAG: hypothetical protein K1X31_14320 [Gemmatimonadaceae bacterium]|nr:hypothetical protein [Gemmatimonadaceae bacterium]